MPYEDEDSNKKSSRDRRRQKKEKYVSEEDLSEVDSEKEQRKRRLSRRRIEDDDRSLSPEPKDDEKNNRKEKKKRRERHESDKNYEERKKKSYDNEGYEKEAKEKSRRKRRKRRDEEKVSTIELKHFSDPQIRFDAAKQELNGDLNGYLRSFFEPEYGEDVANRISYIRRRVSTSHQFYKFFLKFCRIIQGLLAGICLWQIVIVYGGGAKDPEDFIHFYSPLAVPFQAIYCVFAAISLVFIGDRLICRFLSKTEVEPLPLVWRIFSWTTLAGIIYFIGFVLSLVQAPTDMSIHLAAENVTHWLEYSDNTHSLRAWQIGTLFRCLCGLIGFLAVVFEPTITFS